LVQPILFFYKKAIQLNHEFLADEKVVNAYNNVPFYQSLLLKGKREPNFYLASNLNYLITKNDYHDDKTTSNSKSIAKKIILIPLYWTNKFNVHSNNCPTSNKQQH
jgi:hypothetical protein